MNQNVNMNTYLKSPAFLPKSKFSPGNLDLLKKDFIYIKNDYYKFVSYTRFAQTLPKIDNNINNDKKTLKILVSTAKS